MILFKRSLFILAGTLILWSCNTGEGKGKIEIKDTVGYTAFPTPSLPEAEKKRYAAQIEYFFARNHFLRNFNGGILIAKNGVPVYEYYKGFSNLRTKDSMTAETPLQIASTSKPFTGAAVVQLAAQGKLSLDDLVSKFFPGFPYPQVTVKTLLNHRSGLPNYLYYMEQKNRWDRKRLATNNDILSTLFNWQPPPAYRFNANFNYCNTNYVILASIVEKVTGVPFPQYMKSQFFDKLGMKNTYISTIGDTASVQSYKHNGQLWDKDFSDGPYGDKNIYSTPRDLLKWDQAWYNGQVLPQNWIDSAFTPYSNERPSQHNYGLGWRLLNTKTGKKVVYHNGHWHGFNSAFARLIDENATIIILSNRYNNAVYPVARSLYNVFGNYTGKGMAGEQ